MEKQEIREIEQRCMEEEKNLIFDTFSQTEALKLGSFIYEKSKNCSGSVAIEIRINRLTVFSFFPDGTNENNLLWLRAKAKTVDMTQKSSLRFWIDVQLSGSSPENKRMPENEYACCGGGFPLTVKNAGVIGTICVSGLPQYRKLRGLLLAKDAHGLYEKFGFETVKDRAMVKAPEN